MSSRSRRPRTLYARATAVVVDPSTLNVLLVKHNRENQWSLPGGRIMATEEPSRRAAIEVAEETGILIDEPVFAGRYAGSRAAHQIFVATGEGNPSIDTSEIQDATWWDLKTPLRVQRHVGAILAIVKQELRQQSIDRESAIVHTIERLPVPLNPS